MKSTHTRNISHLFFTGKDPHRYTPVDLTLGRAGLMDGAYNPPITDRTQKRTCMGMSTGKLEVVKKCLFVFINNCLKQGVRCDTGAGKGIRPGSIIDDDIVTQIHAALTTLYAGKNHVQYGLFHLMHHLIQEFWKRVVHTK